MQAESGNFSYSTSPEPHRTRTQEILNAYPEIRQYVGKNPYTFWLILLVVMLQLGLAILMRNQSWWLHLLLAYTVGAIATHALAMMVHECAHNLLFKKSIFNYLAGILANLAMAVPSAVFFKRYHLKHHTFQGVYELDADLASRWEADLIGHSSLRKALWLLFFPLFQMTRMFRLREINPVDRWLWMNILVVCGFDLALWMLVGPRALVYLLFSLFFAMGLHPVGARWIQEHYLVHPTQETYSYYGPLNLLCLNVGYHNEHHDFPSVPWNNLPKLKRTAPTWYDSLVSHRSWTKLLIRFVFDPKLSLYSRMVRQNRGGLPLTQEFKPDVESSQEA